MEEEAIAALLHDALEDAKGRIAGAQSDLLDELDRVVRELEERAGSPAGE